MSNIFWISLWSMELGLQVLIAAGLWSSFVPIPTDGFLKGILPFFHDMVRPEREMSLFGLLIMVTLGVQVLALRFLSNDNAKPRALLGALALALQLTGVFHIILHNDPSWARAMLYLGMALYLCVQFFAGQVIALWNNCSTKKVSYILEIAAVLLTVLIIFVPDWEAAAARIYMGDSFHHFDQSMVGPAWASLSGDILDVDVISQYGLGMPILVGFVAKLLGGSYAAFFGVLVIATLVYFLFFYALLRSWLKNIPLALAGTWLAIKLQVFHPTVFPFALTYPSTTVIRFFCDCLFFFCVWRYLSGYTKKWLVASGICAGLAIFYMSSTGMCLALTFGLLILATHRKDLRSIIGYGGVVVISSVIFLGLAQGSHLFDPIFWRNIGEFNNYFLSGFGTVPVYENLLSHNFWAFWMGLIIPAIYLWTLVFLGGLVWTGRASSVQLLAMLLSFYGLAMYHYYIARSAPTSFYCVAVPFVAVVSYWLKELIVRLPSTIQARLSIALAIAALILLWVNPQFAAYPNVFNGLRHYSSKGLGVLPLPDGKPYFNHTVVHTARIPAANSLGESDERLLTEGDFGDIQALKEFFRSEFDFSEDAKLINALTSPKDKVALLSSFDVRILMQSNRRPFFYHYPVFLSRPMRMRAFAVPSIYTIDQLKRTITQLETEKPEYVFIERIYSRDNTGFADSTNALQMLLIYVHSHYAPVAQGRYLMALKRGAI